MDLNAIFEKIKTYDNSILISILCILTICFVLGFIIGALIQKLKLISTIKKEKQEALNKSRAILKGQIFEQLSPIMPSFPVNTKELRFLGSPIDYIAFVSSKENDEIIDEIVFIEVKTASSTLNATEASIKEAIKKKKVKFIEYRI